MTNRYYIGLHTPVRIGAVGASTTPGAAVIRTEAFSVAANQPGNYTGVWYRKDGTNGFVPKATRADLDDWYGMVADHQADYAYVAAFDRTDGTSWPDPWAEFGDAVLTATVTSKPPPAPQKQGSGMSLGVLFAIGAAGVGGLYLAGKKKGQRL